MDAALLVIPLVALVIPILLLLAALVFDVAFLTWIGYGVWHDRVHVRWGRLLHR